MSIKDLRCYFHKMHLIRRIFVCCLLSMSADKNDYQEFKQWKCVVANLDKSSTLMKNLSESILDTIYLMESNNEHTDHNINKNANSQKCSKSKIKWKSHLKSLDNISFSLRHIEARMQIAKEESIRITKMLNINATCSEKQLSPLEKEPFISDDSDQHTVMKNYNEIGKELKSLLEAWEMGKSELQNALDPNTLGESIKMPVAKISEENIFKQDLEQPMTPNEMEDGSVVSNATTYIDDYFGSTGDTKMTILEAIADDDFKKRNDLKGLSRMQRIHKVKEMRSKESERRAESEKHNRLLLELKNVLETNRHC
ncbi:hypothetical protein NADFUDRAFT_82223 [Nadsonia fulvescens var. elongata DSM 6958]|uniref:Myosin-binding domain-containing protein n=1 Tax=Nadsonia fulvescens var. elongata DSM 6958 TaxID=857566 RepID=A0A1E3PM65_9ASCO|nr:hypothetical protein NADFUDRAFT_82223 [Nadsonia fulvescens var. elongata DSM 6958]